MNSKVKNILFTVLVIPVLFLLYWPALNGWPLWDDISFWFNDPVIRFDYSYLDIWSKFSWPLSVSAQKLLWNLFGEKFWRYHALNLILHWLNAWLLYLIADDLKLRWRRWILLFFLFHPANVITVAWMIQLKTILCLLFALLSFKLILEAEFKNKKRYLVLAWMMFLLSSLSKSASLPLPVIFLAICYFRGWRKDLVWLIPFFVISTIGAYRVLSSPVTLEAIQKLRSSPQPIPAETGSRMVKNKEALPAVAMKPQAPSPVPKKSIDKKEKPSKKKVDLSPSPVPPVSQVQAPVPTKRIDPSLALMIERRFYNFLKTLRYYFWQTILPVRNEPVKGFNYDPPGFFEVVQLLFLLVTVYLLRRSALVIALLSGFLMLLPFLGLIPAPYMNLTWVSDQHLYLSLPFFLYFWLGLLEKLKNFWKKYVPYAMLALYAFLVFESAHYYKDEINFFEASHKADILNVPVAYNLVLVYLRQGETNLAFNLASTMVSLAEVSPEVRNNKYFLHMFIIHNKLNSIEKAP